MPASTVDRVSVAVSTTTVRINSSRAVGATSGFTGPLCLLCSLEVSGQASRLGHQHAEPGTTQTPHPIRVLCELAETSRHRLTVGQRLTAALIIERERHAAELRETAGSILLELIEPQPLMSNHSGEASPSALARMAYGGHGVESRGVQNPVLPCGR